MRKPDFCICENKDADQLRGNREADQRLCFRCTDSTIPLLPKSEISSLLAFSVTVQSGLCRTWSETPKTGFLRTRLIFHSTKMKMKPNVTAAVQSRCIIYGLKEIYLSSNFDMSRVTRESIFGVYHQVRHKLGCTATGDG